MSYKIQMGKVDILIVRGNATRDQGVAAICLKSIGRLSQLIVESVISQTKLPLWESLESLGETQTHITSFSLHCFPNLMQAVGGAL